MSKQLLKGFNGQGLYAERAESDHLGRPFTETYLTKRDQPFVVFTVHLRNGVYYPDRSISELKNYLAQNPPVVPVARVIEQGVMSTYDMTSYDGQDIHFSDKTEIVSTSSGTIRRMREYVFNANNTFALQEQSPNNAVYSVETMSIGE